MADLEPYSSPWWLDRLGKQLDQRATSMLVLDAYYNGKQPLAYASDEFRKQYGGRFGRWSDNFCKPVVQALEERLTVQGFRFGDPVGDRKAWRIWQANGLDAQSQKAHREAIVKGDCPVIVGPPATTGGDPVIRVQKPEEMVIAYGDDPLERAVAMKRWRSADRQLFATLYFADRLEKYRWDESVQGRDLAGRFAGTGIWTQREVSGEPWPLPHDFGAVPVVAIINDPDLDNAGASEIADVIPLQDGLNKLFVDLLTASEYAAFRQRWATGLEIPINPETKQPVEAWMPAVQRVWATPSTDAKFGDFEQTNVTGMIRAIELTLQHLAAKTRTPAHYFVSQGGQPASGESLKSAETGLVAKARRRTRDFGEGWEEIERLSFTALGDTKRAAFIAAETIWRDPETRTEAEHVDALTKLAAIGVPEEQLWADAGYTPQQIERFIEMRARQPQVPVLQAVPAHVTETTTGPAVAGALVPATTN